MDWSRLLQPQNESMDNNKLLQMMMGSSEPTLASLMRGVPAAYYNFKGADLKPLQNISGQISNLSDAFANPDNPTYQRLYNEERGQNQQDLAAAINEMANQNRKLTSLGRVPLFDPERGGEQMFRTTVQGYQNAQNNARDRARQIISGGQNALQNTFSNQAAIMQGQQQNKKSKALGFSNIADAIPSLLKMFG